MALQLLLTCRCGHALGIHDVGGCTHRSAGVACRCPANPNQIVEDMITLEREDHARQWSSPSA